MNEILISDAAGIRQASAIAFENHLCLKAKYPWLPSKTIEEFIPRIEWLTREGRVYALNDEGNIRAFLGWFKLDDFRNIGLGALTPDWALGVKGTTDAGETSRLMSPLVRHLMSDLRDQGIPVHAVGVPSETKALIDEFSLLGYGRIVLDAARPARELLSSMDSQQHATPPVGTAIRVRQATRRDAPKLAALDGKLAKHIESPPVLMPSAHGSTTAEWEEWLSDDSAVTFVAERATDSRDALWEPVGFIKADLPQMDVSWFVHDPATLAICGLYVVPECRGLAVGRRLLYSLGACAIERGYELVSVDCETHNPEARAFWLSRFAPVSWSFERRF